MIHKCMDTLPGTMESADIAQLEQELATKRRTLVNRRLKGLQTLHQEVLATRLRLSELESKRAEEGSTILLSVLEDDHLLADVLCRMRSDFDFKVGQIARMCRLTIYKTKELTEQRFKCSKCNQLDYVLRSEIIPERCFRCETDRKMSARAEKAPETGDDAAVDGHVDDGTTNTCIYFLQRGSSGPIKIGVTGDVVARCRQLQTGSSEPLVLLGTVTGDRLLEETFHDKFKHLQTNGEWFLPSEELLAFIRNFKSCLVREDEPVRELELPRNPDSFVALREAVRVRPQTDRLRHLIEYTWLSELRHKFPKTTFPRKWGGKESGQLTFLLDLYATDVVLNAMSFVIDSWESINARFLKGKGIVPTLSLLVRFHEALVPESQQSNGGSACK